MIKPAVITRVALVAFVPLLALAANLAWASSEGALQESHADVRNPASLQRGAALFMNYCSGCHSLRYQRYVRLAEDIGLDEGLVMANLAFTGAKFGETIVSAMPAGDATAWLGKAPPDLSLVARNKPGGPDWTYTFLKSFYSDESRPSGWNNTVLPNTSMPNVLWELQGVQRAVFAGEGGQGLAHVERLEPGAPGRLDPAQYEQVVRDLTNFLTYVGEPAKLKRESMGVWVLLYLALFTLIAWLLKKEYWRDVH